jgi:carotenoid cleavage dioxygenase-like enzyme
MVGIDGGGFVHSVRLHAGGASYLARHVGPDAAVQDVVAFEGSLLVFGEDAAVRQLSTALDTLHRVDLAGRGRAVAAGPNLDPATGELHLVARESDGAQTHVVVTAGALTRRSRPILGPRRPIRGLALDGDHVLFVADGAVGLTPRDGEALPTWRTTDAPAPRPVHAHRAGETVVLLVTSPSLEQWALHSGRQAVERTVLDPTPLRRARTSAHGPDGAPRFVWSAGTEAISRHDVLEHRRVVHRLAPHVPGDFVLVPDSTPPGAADAGWFVGLVHHPTAATTQLRVIDLADPASAAVATVHLPSPVPLGLRGAWLPSTPPGPAPQPRQRRRSS